MHLQKKSSEKRHTQLKSIKTVCLLVIAVSLLSSVLTGAVCWNAAKKATEEQAAKELQSRLDASSVSQAVLYERLLDGWNQTLTDVCGDVIFFGDSLTADGDWAEYFPYLSTINLGVVGDTVDCLIKRLPQIEMLMSEKCFLMIGVNDLVYGRSMESILQNYEELLKGLSSMSEDFGMKVYVQNILPVCEDLSVRGVRNADIRLMNEHIKALAEKYHMTCIDVHSVLMNEAGELENNFSFDGLHLTELGYQAWQETLIPYLDE